jgi:hypothetical protein
MNEYDPLEAELAAYRPHEPTAELEQRIANRLTGASAGGTNRSWSSMTWIGAVAGGLIAAGVVVLVWWRGEDRRSIDRGTTSVTPPLLATTFDQASPSLWVYHRQLTRAPEALDALLDQHSAHVLETPPERARAFVLAHHDFDLDAHFGDP